MGDRAPAERLQPGDAADRPAMIARAVALLGAALLAGGAFADWATVRTTGATLAADGLDHGGIWALTAAGVGVVAVLGRVPQIAAAVALLVSGFLALTLYTLPGTLLGSTAGAFEVSITLGADVCLLGALVLLGGAVRAWALARAG